MTHEQIIATWNAQADQCNQWDHLGEYEKVEWAYSLGISRVAALEAECLEQARCNGMGAEREAALQAKIARLEANLLALKETT